MEWFKKIIEKAADENGNINIEVLVKEFDREFSRNAVIRTKYDELADRLEGSLKELEEKNGIISRYEDNDIDGLKAEIQRLKENEKNIIRSSAVDLALVKAGAKNLKAARALIELDGEFDENMLNEQIKSLSQNEESSFLFSQNGSFAGFRPEEGESFMEKSFDEMSYSEMCRFLEN